MENQDKSKRGNSYSKGGGQSDYKKRSFSSNSSDRPYKKPFNRTDNSEQKQGGFKSENNRFSSDDRKKSFSNSSDRPYKKSFNRTDNSEQKRDGFKRDNDRFSSDDRKKSFSNSSDRPYKKLFNRTDNSEQKRDGFKRDNDRFSSDDRKKSFSNSSDRPYKKPFNRTDNGEQKRDGFKRDNDRFSSDDRRKQFNKPYDRPKKTYSEVKADKDIRLNKFIADAGICSRRNADTFITAGSVQINGEVMTQLGYRVKPTDVVKFDGKIISSEKKEYILLNKPKGFITTTDDERGRKTVMDLVANATNARILPVGRLDRPTTGLLLLTNDGDLAKKLTHPSHGVRKIYHVILDKKLEYKDLVKIEEGLELEDGFVEVDEISYINNSPKNEVGVKIHSGKNRIVRRIFEHLGYQIEKLDRVVFAGLTKKDLPRGHWRHLTQQEVINLKNL